MTPITPEQLAEWARLAEQATPGPLEMFRYDHGGGRLFASNGRELVADYYHEGDREFYFAAREAVPAMVAEIERLTAERDHALALAGGLQADNRNLHRQVEALTLERDALLNMDRVQSGLTVVALDSNHRLLVERDAARAWSKAWKRAAKLGFAAMKRFSDMKLRKFDYEDGKWQAQMQGEIIPMLADWFSAWFTQTGGRSYVEIELFSDTHGPFTLTMQRTYGKTPHQLKVSAEAERNTLRGAAQQAREALRGIYDRMNVLRDVVVMDVIDTVPGGTDCLDEEDCSTDPSVTVATCDLCDAEVVFPTGEWGRIVHDLKCELATQKQDDLYRDALAALDAALGEPAEVKP